MKKCVHCAQAGNNWPYEIRLHGNTCKYVDIFKWALVLSGLWSSFSGQLAVDTSLCFPSGMCQGSDLRGEGVALLRPLPY